MIVVLLFPIFLDLGKESSVILKDLKSEEILKAMERLVTAGGEKAL